MGCALKVHDREHGKNIRPREGYRKALVKQIYAFAWARVQCGEDTSGKEEGEYPHYT